ncbi:MAG TPA: Na+/H+ antiporter NhaA [Terriglobales bacterium]|nr:Na+/H+ antiporter NhaA [Terriglobales bacterium]
MTIPPRRLGQLNVDQEFSFATRHIEVPAQEFIYREGVSAILLLSAALLALGWANSPWADYYYRFWQAELSFDLGFLHVGKDFHHWINDGLMALFFFLVGMEIKHELAHGYLSTRKQAFLPVIAALGGMIVPATLFLVLTHATPFAPGWGISMATDIAFAVGILSLLPGISSEAKVLLLALAIADDIGAIAVIAFFYSETIQIAPLVFGGALLLGVYGLRWARVRFAFPYVLLGILFWMAILKSGIHASIAGVVLAFMVSTRQTVSRSAFEERSAPILAEFRQSMREDNVSRADANLGALEALVVSTDSPIERLTRALHPWVAFVVLPLFAFANSGITFSASAVRASFQTTLFWGVVVGLVLGKPIGIFLFSWIAARTRLASLPNDMSFRELAGIGIVAGIGFTVSIFIAGLAYENLQLVNISKFAILVASTVAGICGYLWLRFSGRKTSTQRFSFYQKTA